MATLTARGIATLATSACPRVRLLGYNGYTPAKAAEVFYQKPKETGSAFAYASGLRFEQALTKDAAERLRELYGSIADIGPDEVADLEGDPTKEEGAHLFDVARDLITTRATEGTGPRLILQAPVRLALHGRHEILRPDVLIWRGNQWHVGEIKSYLDRGGETDGAKVRGSLLQAAAGVLAVTDLITAAGISPSAVSDRADLIYQLPTTNPSLHSMSVTAELEQLRALTAKTVQTVRIDRPVIDAEPHIYTARCDLVCAMAEVCGDDARRAHPDRVFFGGPGADDLELMGITMERARALWAGAEPQNPDEAVVADAVQAWRQP